MTTFKTDPETHDIVLENNSFVMLDGGPEETEQRLRETLGAWRGEWFLNVTEGVPYRETVFAAGVSPETRAAALKREILRTPGVIELRSYNQTIDTATRQMTVQFSALSTEGEIIEFDEEIP